MERWLAQHNSVGATQCSSYIIGVDRRFQALRVGIVGHVHLHLLRRHALKEHTYQERHTWWGERGCVVGRDDRRWSWVRRVCPDMGRRLPQVSAVEAVALKTWCI